MNKNFSTATTVTIIIALIALCVALIVFLPLGLLFSINTLFAANLAYNLTNWFAAWLLIFLFGSGKPTTLINSAKKG